jgi:hypothetical protein
VLSVLEAEAVALVEIHKKQVEMVEEVQVR